MGYRRGASQSSTSPSCRGPESWGVSWITAMFLEANFGMLGASANGGGTAFFAHVGGFVFGALVALLLASAGRVGPQDGTALRAPA